MANYVNKSEKQLMIVIKNDENYDSNNLNIIVKNISLVIIMNYNYVVTIVIIIIIIIKQ